MQLVPPVWHLISKLSLLASVPALPWFQLHSEHIAGRPWRRRAAGFAALEPFLPHRYKIHDTRVLPYLSWITATLSNSISPISRAAFLFLLLLLSFDFFSAPSPLRQPPLCSCGKKKKRKKKTRRDEKPSALPFPVLLRALGASLLYSPRHLFAWLAAPLRSLAYQSLSLTYLSRQRRRSCRSRRLTSCPSSSDSLAAQAWILRPPVP